MRGRGIKYPQVTSEALFDLYWNQEKSIPEVAHALGIPESSMGNYFRRFNIPRRNSGEYHAVAIKHGKMKGKSISVAPEELRRLYWDDKLSLYDIGKQLGVSPDTIHYKMRKFGIPTRSVKQRNQLVYDNGNRLKRDRFQKTDKSYVMILRPEHTRATKHGYIAEHLEVWENANGKSLPEGWVIHHINGIKNDNRPENLAGMPAKNHHGFLVEQVLKKRIRELEAELKGIKSQTKLDI